MGLQIVTTVTSPATATPPAGAYDLTSLANAKDELDLPATDTTKDARLARYITEASAAINNYCNHVFAVEGLTDLIYLDQDPYPYQTPGGVAPLQLSRWPVVNVTTIAISAVAAAGATVLGFANVPATVAVGQPVSGPNVAPGATITAVTPGAGGTVTISQGLTAANAAGALITCGLSVFTTIALNTYQALVLDTDYDIDLLRGHLERLNPFTGIAVRWEALPVTVQYYAGWATVPPDVEQACLRLVTERYHSRGRDPTIRATEGPTIGRKEYWVGGPPKSGAIPLEIAGILDNYRVPVAF